MHGQRNRQFFEERIKLCASLKEKISTTIPTIVERGSFETLLQ